MKLTEYLKGDKRGKQANELERRAQEDPFLADALEGYGSVYDNHFDRLTALEQKIESLAKSAGRRKILRRSLIWGSTMGLAASLMIAVVLYVGQDADISPYEANVVLEGVIAQDEMLALYYDGSKQDIAIPKDAYLINGEIVLPDTVTDMQAYHSETSIPPQEEEYVIPDPPGEISDLSRQAEIASEPIREEMLAMEVSASKEKLSAGSGNEVPDNVAETKSSSVTGRVSVDDMSDEYAAAESSAVPVAQNTIITEDGIIYTQNEEFERLFNKVRTVTVGDDGSPLKGKEIIAEFRVNSRGVPSSIKIISSPSRELNKELINALSSHGIWEPSNTRIRMRITL